MMKCPKCGATVSELDEKCKQCGVNFEKYEQSNRYKKNDEETVNGYVTGYNVFLGILGILIFIGGIILGQEDVTIMFVSWIGGAIFLVFMNMLKDILEELRKISSIINNTIEEEQEIRTIENKELENDKNSQLNELISKLEK